MPDNILVTGGAGYIGSHTCLRLAEAGFTPVVYDNLSNGHEAAVQWGPIEIGDIRDQARLIEVLEKWRPAGVIHFAAMIEVAESFRDVSAFYDVNVRGGLTLIRAMQQTQIERLVFSSTCATYGAPLYSPIDEGHAQHPINPYGTTKLLIEMALADYARQGALKPIILRYFNAAGADPQGRIGERHDPETHVVPIAIETALGMRADFKVFGEDYDTRDGTAVRDYVHVLDLADAHVLAMLELMGDRCIGETFNLGTGNGTTVRELIQAVANMSAKPLKVTSAPRRKGDPAVLVADSRHAHTLLNWSPKHDLKDIVKTAWEWHKHRTALT